MLICIETITFDFSGGTDPLSLSGSAHAVHSKVVVLLLLLLIYCFMYLPLLLGVCIWSLFWYALLCVLSSSAITLARKNKRGRADGFTLIARHLGLHYNHFVSPSFCPLPVSETVHNS